MSRRRSLEKLEELLESFLARAVVVKEERLEVLNGINRLDDIARMTAGGDGLIEPMGQWFAEHDHWLKESSLKPADINRIGGILDRIKSEIEPAVKSSPAAGKIRSEMDRWAPAKKPASRKLVLRRGPESAEESYQSTTTLFDKQLERIVAIYKDLAGSHEHILSALDDALKSAELQKNKDALILSGAIIYYLKQNRYLVDPYVRRLKQAERLIKAEQGRA